jgi:pyruvate kinase
LLDDRSVRAGESLTFALDARDGVPVPHPELFAAVAPGQILSCDDDRLRFRVETVARSVLGVVSLRQGTLRARKGVNVMDHPVALQDLTAADVACLAATGAHGGIAYAVSFMATGAEAGWVRARAPGSVVVGKVERDEALRSLAAIDEAVDATWICRGDLGAQVGVAAMARWIALLDPRALLRPTLMAGQVLEHLTAHAEPTRSEACHVVDLALRGYAGLVLSDETAIGRDPVAAVRAALALWAAARA